MLQCVKERVLDRVVELIDKSYCTQGILIPVPKIQYRLRGRDVAGVVYLNHWAVDFNPMMLKAFEDEFINVTVGHEIAHLVAVAKANSLQIFPHGREWQQTMRHFCLPIRVNHNYVI